ncbi:autophagy protein, partial [Coelomomyces lativittatus]
MRLIYSIETNYHPNMVTAMSPSSDCNYLAYPSFSYPTDGNGSATNPNSTLTPLQSTSPTSSTTTSTASPSLSSGNITLFDIQSLQPVLILSAHKAPIAVMTFSYTGRYLATASTKGTLIRVFSVPGGTPLYEFRRGTYPVTLFHLCFHPNETYLAVSSETETLHVFKLLVPTTSSTLFHGLTSLWHRKLPSYFPSMVTHRMMDPTRDFAFGKLPSSCVGYKASVGFSTTSPHLFVVTQEG